MIGMTSYTLSVPWVTLASISFIPTRFWAAHGRIAQIVPVPEGQVIGAPVRRTASDQGVLTGYLPADWPVKISSQR